MYKVLCILYDAVLQVFEVRFCPLDLDKMTAHRKLLGGRKPRSWLRLGSVDGQGTSAATAARTRHGKSSKCLSDGRASER